MIPVWIIEELTRREEQERRREEQQRERLELPLNPNQAPTYQKDEPGGSEGPIVIDLWPE